MSASYYYSLCNQYRGRAVKIRTHDGRVHRGIIRRVNSRMVYLQPFGGAPNLGGYGYGFYGPRYGGFGYGLALGAIATLALIPFFFW